MVWRARVGCRVYGYWSQQQQDLSSGSSTSAPSADTVVPCPAVAAVSCFVCAVISVVCAVISVVCAVISVVCAAISVIVGVVLRVCSHQRHRRCRASCVQPSASSSVSCFVCAAISVIVGVVLRVCSHQRCQLLQCLSRLQAVLCFMLRTRR
jgi:hypothetical protein